MLSDSAIVLLLVVLIAISEACGQAALKKCHIESRWEFFGIAVLFYITVCALLFKVYSYKEMSIVNILWSGLSVLLMVTLGVTVFHEKLAMWDIIGICFIAIGMFFVFVKGH